MHTQHNEEVVFCKKVEDTSHRNETIKPMEDVTKTAIIYASVDDPLLLELKEEIRNDEEAEDAQSTKDESMDDVDESSEEESSTEK